MKMNILLIALWAVVLSFPMQASAIVSIANGNYFVSAIDLVHPAPLNGFQIKIQRSCNSRSQYDGLFGYGCGTDYESYLIPQSDGGVVIQEAGGGDKTRFSPKEFSRESLEKHIQSLVQERSKQSGFTGVQAYKEHLLRDANFRDEEVRALGVFPRLAVGTKLYTSQRGEKQLISITNEGYIREYADGKQEYFTQKADVVDQGVDSARRRILKGVFKVSRLTDPAKNIALYYLYDTKGQLTTITDKKTQTVRLTYNPAGKVIQAIDARGNKATYKYCDTGGSAYSSTAKCGMGDLIEAHTTNPAVFFKYQYDNIHNLTRIQFADGRADETTYWPTNLGGGVKTFLSRDGTLTEYKYWKDPKAPEENYKTEFKTSVGGKMVSQSSYEYFDKARADGSRYRYKLITGQEGNKTETIYNECCGQPIQIKSAAGETKFEYYAGTGLPKEKNTPSEVIQWEYHPKLHGKITKVKVLDKASKAVKSSVFTYDEKSGQLKLAKTSDGKGVALAYDTEGRIRAMVDQDKRQISFKYNNDSKPAEILQDGVGSIQVSYDKDGQIRDVKSKGGRQISMSVSAAFQNLLEIIKPAGIQPL